jgi:hypothetical protein
MGIQMGKSERRRAEQCAQVDLPNRVESQNHSYADRWCDLQAHSAGQLSASVGRQVYTQFMHTVVILEEQKEDP